MTAIGTRGAMATTRKWPPEAVPFSDSGLTLMLLMNAVRGGPAVDVEADNAAWYWNTDL